MLALSSEDKYNIEQIMVLVYGVLDPKHDPKIITKDMKNSLTPIMKIFSKEWPNVKPTYFRLRHSTRDIIYSTIRNELQIMHSKRNHVVQEPSDKETHKNFTVGDNW